MSDESVADAVEKMSFEEAMTTLDQVVAQLESGSAPLENPVHPSELLATIYHSVGIDPETIVYNHLNQPRELVKARPVSALFA